MTIHAIDMHLVALDEAGQPTGESVSIGTGRVTLRHALDAAGYDVEFPAWASPREVSFTMRTPVDLVANAALRRAFGLRLAPAGLRKRRYMQRTRGHAPRRRNRHGRVGVRR